MTSKPYHVYLSISQFGPDRYRSELFTEHLGSTDGELVPIDWQGVDEWLDFLNHGAIDAEDAGVQKLGIRLFEHTLGVGANRAKWADVVRYAREHDLALRMLIDTSIPLSKDESEDKIHNLPYGLLRARDENYYLFAP